MKNLIKISPMWEMKLDKNARNVNLDLKQENDTLITSYNFPVRKFKNNITLNKEDVNTISQLTRVEKDTIYQAVKDLGNYLKSNPSEFEHEIELETFFIPSEPHQADINRAAKFFMKDNYCFVDESTTDNNEVVRYVYDEEKNKFIKLNRFKLAQYVFNKYNFLIANEDRNKILESVLITEKSNPNLIQFKNGFYDIRTNELNNTPVFTHNIIEHNYVPLEYCVKDTVIERTMKSILIPKNKQDDRELYYTVLGYIGAMLLGAKSKTILYFYDKGNGGKTILMRILASLFGNMNITIKENELVDKFTPLNFGNRMSMILDEVSNKCFVDENTRATIKDISGNGRFQCREMKSDTLKTIENTGLPLIASNYLPQVPHSDIAYYERLQFFTTPNTFVNSENNIHEGENAYLANPLLSSEIDTDEAGFTWLISASIEAYRKFNGELPYQVADKTLTLINGGDILTNFLGSYVRKSEGNSVGNKELVYYFMKYCLNNDFDYTDIDDCENISRLRRLLGYSMKKLGYEKDLDSHTRRTIYKDVVIQIDFKDNGSFTQSDFQRLENKFFKFDDGSDILYEEM